jgi:hypothetical protein
MSSRRWQGVDSFPDPIGDLLDLAGISKTPETRSELDEALDIARGAYDFERQKQAPSDLFEQLDASIGRTLMLIAKLGKYPRTRDIAFEQHPIGTGIADATTTRETIEEGRNLRVSRRPWVNKGPFNISMDDVVVGINVENLLRAFRVSVGKARGKKKRGRGHPKRTDKLSVVLYAADFFRAYSATKPSTDGNNPFRLFVERFFEVATDTKAPNLEWQVRQALHNYDDPRVATLRYGERREKLKKDK